MTYVLEYLVIGCIFALWARWMMAKHGMFSYSIQDELGTMIMGLAWPLSVLYWLVTMVKARRQRRELTEIRTSPQRSQRLASLIITGMKASSEGDEKRAEKVHNILQRALEREYRKVKRR